MKRLLALLIFTSIIFTSLPAFAAGLDLANADSAVLIDAKTGVVLYGKDPDRQRMYPASTTKIMTAALALEKGDLNQLMTASQAAVDDIGKDGMNIGIMAGEQIKLSDLLQALLISSANETANIIAENIAPTRQDFVDMMNAKAKELGALNTHFVNPCGSQDKDHYTTAADLAKIARYAMTFPKIREIASKRTYQLPATNKHSEWPVLASTNNLMKFTKIDLFTVTGLKTGYTVPAGHCLVSTAVNANGMELIAVILGVRNDDSKNKVVEYSKNLLTYGYENFVPKSLDNPGRVVETVPVSGAEEGFTVDVTTKSGLEGVAPLDGRAWQIDSKVEINPVIEAPVKKGDILGHIEYSKDGQLISKADLVAASDVASKKIAQKVLFNPVSNNTPIVLRIALYCLFALVAFALVKFILRFISRRIRAKRYLR